MNILPFVHSPMDGYLVFSSYQLLCVKLLWIFMFKSLFGHILLFFMGKYQECNCWVMPFYIPTINVWWFQLFHLLVIYCCIENSYKCRSLRQYTIIITQFMQVRNFEYFASRSLMTLQSRCYHSWGSSGSWLGKEPLPSSCVFGWIHFLVGHQATATFWMLASDHTQTFPPWDSS